MTTASTTSTGPPQISPTTEPATLRAPAPGTNALVKLVDRPATPRDDSARAVVPRLLRITAELGWRLLVVVAAVYVLGWAASYVAAVVIPVAVALLLAALLSPAVHRLQTHRVPRGSRRRW